MKSHEQKALVNIKRVSGPPLVSSLLVRLEGLVDEHPPELDHERLSLVVQHRLQLPNHVLRTQVLANLLNHKLHQAGLLLAEQLRHLLAHPPLHTLR